MRLDRSTRPAALTAAAILLAVSVVACGSSDKSKPQSPAFNLTVVDVLPLTGALAPLGEAGRKAADLAAAQVSGAIKQTGAHQSLALVHVNDKGDPSAAVAASRRAIAKPG